MGLGDALFKKSKKLDVDFNRFSDHARTAVKEARHSALRFNHEYIGTEHLLIGLTRGVGLAEQALRALGLDARQLESAVEKILQHGPPMVSIGQLPFIPRAKRALILAQGEASTSGTDAIIDTHHLLIGLINERDGIAARVLTERGVTVEKVYAALKISSSPQPGLVATRATLDRTLDMWTNIVTRRIQRIEERLARAQALLKEVVDDIAFVKNAFPPPRLITKAKKDVKKTRKRKK